MVSCVQKQDYRQDQKMHLLIVVVVLELNPFQSLVVTTIAVALEVNCLFTRFL
jgi:hypothetical protein